MYAKNNAMKSPKVNIWPGTGLLLVIIAISVSINRSTIPEASMLSAFTIVAGILAMAGLMSSTRSVPRWAWWSSAGAMSAVLAATVLVNPGQWKDVGATAWMLPWFMFILGTSPAKTAKWCDTSSTRGGWLVVGMALVMSTLCVLAPLVPKFW